jgi:hypothetical protein
MSMDHRDNSPEESWPESYEAPTLEPLGSVWDRTGGGIGLENDGMIATTV